MALLSSSFGIKTDGYEPAFLVLGPCAFEGSDHCLFMANAIEAIGQRVDRRVIFKVSFDKANRTKRDSFRGRGLEEALRTFEKIRGDVGLPVMTDVHEAHECDLVAPHVDVLQTPAFLCRQTDLLEAAGATGLPVNIKKGQFLAPEDMKWAADKVLYKGGRPMVCERGSSFGHHNLVNDFRSLRIMRSECDAPVIFDATHSVQMPGSGSGVTSGDRRFVIDLARAATAIGIDGLFMETHQDPEKAPSDGATMVPLCDLEKILRECIELDDFTKAQLANRST